MWTRTYNNQRLFIQFQPVDISGVLTLESELFPDACRTPESLLPAGMKGFSRLYTLRAAGRVIGYILGFVTAEDLDLFRIGIKKSHQGKGYGKILLYFFIVQVQYSDKLEHIFLEVSTHNRAALTLYKHAGFEPMGMRRDYYSPGDDALILRLALNKTLPHIVKEHNTWKVVIHG